MISELEPLVRKVEALKSSAGARDIYESIAAEAAAASNDFMARQVCRRVIAMCHPKAWGDRSVHDIVGWNAFLGELADVANACGEAVNERGRKRPGQ